MSARGNRACTTCAYSVEEEYKDYVEKKTLWGPTYKLQPVRGLVCRWMPNVNKTVPDGWCFQWKERASD